MRMPTDAVLLIAFGGPEKPEDIRPFLDIPKAPEPADTKPAETGLPVDANADAQPAVVEVVLNFAFAKSDLTARFIASWHDGGRQAWLHLAEIDGYVAPDDPRLARFSGVMGAGARDVRQLGGYAVPVSPALMGADART